MTSGVRGRVAGRETVGSKQRPHTAESERRYNALADKVRATICKEQSNVSNTQR